MHMQHKSQYTHCYIKPFFFIHNKYYFPMLKLTNHWFQTTKYADMMFGRFVEQEVLETFLKHTQIITIKVSCYCKMDAEIKEFFYGLKERN